MQRLALAQVLNKNGINIRVGRDVHVTLEVKGVKHEIEGDGGFTHINLARFVADKLGLPRRVIGWPHVPSYINGSLGRLFDKSPDYAGDAAALEEILRHPRPETTFKQWGGVYHTRDLQTLFRDGKYRDLSKEGKFYVNVTAPAIIAEGFAGANPGLVRLESVDDSTTELTIVGGVYDFADKLGPPIGFTALRDLVLVCDGKEMEETPPPPTRSTTTPTDQPPRSGNDVVASTSCKTDGREAEERALMRVLDPEVCGQELKGLLQGPLLISLASRADRNHRKTVLKEFKVEVLENADQTLDSAIEIADAHAKGSKPMLAFLLRQLEGLFYVIFEDRSLERRAGL